jgi:ribosomal protein L10
MIILSRSSELLSCGGGYLQTLIRQTPLIEQIRHRHNVKIFKPKRAQPFRASMLALSKPKWEQETPFEDMWKNCEYVAKVKEKKEWDLQLNQLDKFDVKEMMEQFENSQVIGFFHSNPIEKFKRHQAWQNARRAGMELTHYHYRIGVAGLTGTKWENCLHFWFKFQGDMNLQPIVFSPDLNAEKLLKYERKVPEFTLLGAVVGNRILSKKQLQDLKHLPSLEQSRGELVSLLGYHQQRTLQLLQSNQQQLSTNLSQLIKDGSPPSGTDEDKTAGEKS